MRNNRKRNVIKERIRQEKERRERLLAEEEEQYSDMHEEQVIEHFQQEEFQYPLKQREEVVNSNNQKNESLNSNPALDWITTIQKQSGVSESDFENKKAEEETRKREEAEARRKAEEELRQREEAEARRKAEEELRQREEAEARKKVEEVRKQVEAEARRKAEEEVRKQAEAEARRKIEEKKLEEVRKRRIEEEKKIEEAQKKQKLVVAKGKSESDEINLNKETKPSNKANFEQDKKIKLDKKGILNYMKKYKYAIIGIASIVLIVVVGFAFSTMKSSQAASANNANSLEINTNLVNGLRLSAVQKYQDAALEFDKVDYKKLGKEDKKAVLFTYLLSGKAQKAIDLEKDFAESVVSYYLAVDNLKKVKELKTKNPLINFEIAALDDKHEEVIKLKDQVPLDGRREGIIVNSYLKLNKSEEAKKFAQKVGNKDLLEKINNSAPNSSATSVATISVGHVIGRN
ncbi:cell envelope integrity protein TolA [Bacillus cereus]|nr:cell envelope integrity protein TolA [Bacillus cereus]